MQFVQSRLRVAVTRGLMAVYPASTTSDSSLPVPSAKTTLCSVCNEPVSLETAKTDETGQAIHEECYLVNLNRKQA